MVMVPVAVVMMVVVGMIGHRFTQLVKRLLQRSADRVHLHYRPVKGRDEAILMLVSHRCPPFIEFGDVSAVVFDPMLEKNSELFSVFHCRFLKSQARKAGQPFCCTSTRPPMKSIDLIAAFLTSAASAKSVAIRIVEPSTLRLDTSSKRCCSSPCFSTTTFI